MRKSLMEHRFSEVPEVELPRSTFDRSHGIKTTFDAGYLIPVFVDEVVPGDTFNVDMKFMARLTTPLFPIMDSVYLDTFFFFVPNRLVWTNWEKFCGEQTDPGDSIDYTIPVQNSNATGFSNTSLQGYFGIPTQVASAFTYNALPFRAYNLIWNEWFRDQNLQDSVVVDTDNGPDGYADYAKLRRGKRHDYFTSCLPWPQKGDPVEVPLGTDAPVYGIGKGDQTFSLSSQSVYETDGTGTTSYASAAQVDPTVGTEVIYVEEDASNTGFMNIRADLSNATSATVNEVRQAYQVQKILEKDARAGTRYIEIVKSHFGVTSPDARHQRPEYLGGGSSPVNITPIPQTSETSTDQLGTLGAIGTAYGTGHGFLKSFTEHGYIIGLVSARADLTYQQGLHRLWSRSTRYDVYWPSLAHIGEQSVLNKEIYLDGSATDTQVFGYQERHGEYRYKPSMITGYFKSNEPTYGLEEWHLSQEFGTLPLLDDSFIQDNPPIDRCIATPNDHHFYMDSYFNMRCTRPMPLFGTPGLVDHF